MNEKLTHVLDLIEVYDCFTASGDDEESGRTKVDLTEEIKSLRGLIKKAISDEAMRCAAEVEGLPTLDAHDVSFKEFAVNVLRGMKIY